MKNIVTIAILLASTCIGASSAMAQSERVNVVVPFSFTVNSATLPAGRYSISNIDSSPLIKIDNLSNTRVHALAMGQAPLRASRAMGQLRESQHLLFGLPARSALQGFGREVTRQER